MTFLELAQRLRQEAGISGTGPLTVVGQTGEMLRIVDWINSAYRDIQNLHPRGWKFLQTEFSFPTVAATANYTLAATGLTELATWKVEDVKIYSAVSDESDLTYVDWNLFRYVYQRGSNRTITERPTVFTVKPDRSMTLWAIPNAVFTVNGEYFKRAQTMAVDADEPLIPDQYHMIIVWRAVMFAGAFKGADELYAHGQNEYRDMLYKLEFDQLPEIIFGAPLA